jgi:peptide subunit release factor 1 (eRF1)
MSRLLSTIVSAQRMIKSLAEDPQPPVTGTYHLQAPGWAIFCGTIITDEGKERKISTYCEVPYPVRQVLYLSDKRFHVEVGIVIVS